MARARAQSAHGSGRGLGDEDVPGVRDREVVEELPVGDRGVAAQRAGVRSDADDP
jgi:hypothetical protein